MSTRATVFQSLRANSRERQEQYNSLTLFAFFKHPQVSRLHVDSVLNLQAMAVPSFVRAVIVLLLRFPGLHGFFIGTHASRIHVVLVYKQCQF